MWKSIFSLGLLLSYSLHGQALTSVTNELISQEKVEQEQQASQEQRAQAQELPALANREITIAQDNWLLKHQLISTGPLAGNVTQAFVILPEQGLAYSQRVCGVKLSCVSRFAYTADQYQLVAMDSSIPSAYLGHQGLTWQPTSTGVKLWASAGTHYKNYGRYIVSFDYQANAQPQEPQVYELFSPSFNGTGSPTPAISSDNRYLIARGYQRHSYKSIIRVWDLNQIDLTSEHDLSQKFLYQFALDPISLTQDYPLQGIASDGNFIYVFLGYYLINSPKLLLTYTLEGKLIGREFLQVGREMALKLSTLHHWEAEGINVVDGQLLITIVTGDPGKRISLIYSRDLQAHLAGLAARQMETKVEAEPPLDHINEDNNQ
ncbi:hypothetical protein [Psittacicella gerlachiana]|uniref:P68 RBP/TagC-like beta-propeller domain-containing protein n=1 Tax=Psittacicella gerlachiana TaxID=2028574 RepID=A0A3A1YLF2_9GAMM|nr:hypothetical protein [Psittacicella gerlachiana]RIY38495.1 hypothetical protein CKF59_00735 [Psittacicella gerlachiana]